MLSMKTQSPLDDQARHPSSGLEKLRTSLDQSFAIFVCLNMFAVGTFALLHWFSAAADLQTRLNYRSFVCWIAVETLALFSPAILCFVAFRWFSKSAAIALGLLVTLVMSAVYIVDFAIFQTIREHLLSGVFFRLAKSVLPFLHVYVGTKQLAWVLLGIIGWGLSQFLIWKLAKLLSRTKNETEPNPKQLSCRAWIGLAGLGLCPVLYALFPAFMDFSATTQEIAVATDRHPITATGFFRANNVPTLESDSPSAIRGQATMLDQAHLFQQVIERYNQQQVRQNPSDAANSKTLPDVLIVVSECLRPDVISEKTSPNIFRMCQEGLCLKHHYSAGNASHFSFFGIMFGLDACWYEQADKMSIGMFDGLKQVGYRTGFFGGDDFTTFGMETFCSPDRFDECEFVELSYTPQCDVEVCETAKLFFDRKGRFADHPEAPRLAIVYIYAPHDSIHDEQDKIHTLQDSLQTDVTGRRDNEKFVNFLNSIRFLDRVIEPLLKEDRVTFILGDHGESFGEDMRKMHGSALSEVQIRVGCVGFGPGIPKRSVTKPTSHHDIWPTIADAIDLSFSDPSVFAGISALDPIPNDRRIAVRSLADPNYLFLKPDREPNDPVLGYQGFFDFANSILAPGALIDTYADTIKIETPETDPWQNVPWMLDWMSNRFGPSLGSIPIHPEPLIQRSIKSPDSSIRLKSIDLIGRLGPTSFDFIDALETCLSDPNADVRKEAFSLLHKLHAIQPASSKQP
jgi:membrane-anchored protein YejM (alkaline phosphatase superfamily)